MSKLAPILILQARAQARGTLYRNLEFDTLEEALAPLHQYALAAGVVDKIGAAATADIIEACFAQGGA